MSLYKVQRDFPAGARLRRGGRGISCLMLGTRFQSSRHERLRLITKQGETNVRKDTYKMNCSAFIFSSKRYLVIVHVFRAAQPSLRSRVGKTFSINGFVIASFCANKAPHIVRCCLHVLIDASLRRLCFAAHIPKRQRMRSPTRAYKQTRVFSLKHYD